MTLTDFILRDLSIGRKAWTLDDYNREISRRLWRRRLRAIGEVFGAVAFVALMSAVVWLCCAVSGYHWE